MIPILAGVSALAHDSGPGHPESKLRIERLLPCLEQAGYPLESCERQATRAEILTVHQEAYVDRVLAARDEFLQLDADTRLAPGSVLAALNAAGTALTLADRLIAEPSAGAKRLPIFAVVRPPGHHAMPDQGMGYCVFNNVALAAESLVRRGYRVMVLDLDVHHGNGTEAIFVERSDVMVISIHQDQLYPEDTGGVADVGSGAGAGFTVNIPLPAGSGIAEYSRAFESIVFPLAERFRPGVVLVSAGFDTHGRDPEGFMDLGTADFGRLGAMLTELAAISAQGKLGLILEGGYDVEVLGPSVVAMLEGLGGERSTLLVPNLLSEAAVSVLQEVARIHGLPWK